MSAASDIPVSIVDAQVQRLLEIVNKYQQEQCDVLLEQANQQSQQIIRQAYRDARLRMHRDIQDSRQNMQQELSATRAKLHTMMMQQRHRADQEFLAQSWELLVKKLMQRWLKLQSRKLWVQNVIDTAIQVLPANEWKIVHPQDWSDTETSHIEDLVAGNSPRRLAFVADTNMKAGIRISADGAVVDGSLEGMLTDRVRIESEVLAQCRECIVHTHGQPEN
jgi:F0F1-type ATP synthase membrane subunit b/b'